MNSPMSVTPQTNVSLTEVAASLKSHDDFVICGHVSPDGDCIGSQLALAGILRRLGKRVTCVLAKAEKPDARLSFLPGLDDMVYACDFKGEVGTFVAVDVPSRERIADAEPLLDAASYSITIDHHAYPERMTTIAYVNPSMASTSMLIWELSKCLRVENTNEIAVCAYTGLVTDTGRFQFQNTDSRAFASASEMIVAGVDASVVSRELFQNRTLPSVELEAAAIKHMKLAPNGEVAISYVTQKDFERAHAVKADSEPLIDVLRSIAGVRVACMLRDQGTSIRGSLRAKDGTDVAAIAAAFGGGGHKAAAGFSVDGPIEGALVRVEQAIVAAVSAAPSESAGANA